MNYKIDTKRLDEIISKLNGNTDAICRQAAFEIKAEWDQTSIVGETGALRASCYVATQKEDGYAEASAAARAANPKARTAAHPKPHGRIRAVVGPCVDYALWVEIGHMTRPFTKSYGVRRFVSGRPRLKPAVENVTKRFADMWRKGLLKP